MCRGCVVLLGLSVIMGPRARADAGDGSKSGGAIVVHVKQDNVPVPLVRRAEAVAVEVFAKIGVALVFRTGPENKGGGERVHIELQFHDRVPQNLHPGAMAYATPFAASGTRIHVFCERALNRVFDGGTGVHLGYVIAHEIGHVVEGGNRHSAEGVMKAQWVTADFRQMVAGTLRFDATDTELIQASLTKQVARRAADSPMR
jgi:hypothetical protein